MQPVVSRKGLVGVLKVFVGMSEKGTQTETVVYFSHVEFEIHYVLLQSYSPKWTHEKKRRA